MSQGRSVSTPPPQRSTLQQLLKSHTSASGPSLGSQVCYYKKNGCTERQVAQLGAKAQLKHPFPLPQDSTSVICTTREIITAPILGWGEKAHSSSGALGQGFEVFDAPVLLHITLFQSFPPLLLYFISTLTLHQLTIGSTSASLSNSS